MASLSSIWSKEDRSLLEMLGFVGVSATELVIEFMNPLARKVSVEVLKGLLGVLETNAFGLLLVPGLRLSVNVLLGRIGVAEMHCGED